MKTLNLIIVFLLSVLISSTAYSQECKDFLNSKAFKMAIPKDFKDYGQSKSISAEVNKTNNFEIVLNGNEEYILNIATEPGYGPVHFRIIDSENEIVLFDNEKKNYNESANFYMQKTQSVSVEVTIMNTNGKHSPSKGKHVCLGIKINNRHYTE
jgi:hypothetical protein